MDIALGLLFFALFIGTFGWFIWRGAQIGKRRKAALAALVAARGWRMEAGREGRRQVTTLGPPDGAWTLRLRAATSSGSGNTRTRNPGSTEFRAAQPAWDGGRAIFTQRLPGGVERMQGGAGLVGLLQVKALRTLMARLVPPEVLDDLPNLQAFDAPPGVELTILATEDPRGADLAAIHTAIHGWRPAHGRDPGPAAVMIGREGFGMRLPDILHEAEDIAAFADRAQALAQALR